MCCVVCPLLPADPILPITTQRPWPRKAPSANQCAILLACPPGLSAFICDSRVHCPKKHTPHRWKTKAAGASERFLVCQCVQVFRSVKYRGDEVTTAGCVCSDSLHLHLPGGIYALFSTVFEAFSSKKQIAYLPFPHPWSVPAGTKISQAFRNPCFGFRCVLGPFSFVCLFRGFRFLFGANSAVSSASDQRRSSNLPRCWRRNRTRWP